MPGSWAVETLAATLSRERLLVFQPRLTVLRLQQHVNFHFERLRSVPPRNYGRIPLAKLQA